MNEEMTNLVDLGNGVKVTMPCDKLMEALAKMQGALGMAKKDSDNPFFKSKYADLATCINTAKEPMKEHGLSLSQHCSFDGNCVHCVSVLGHSSGQFMTSELVIVVTKKDAQGIGSAITYARRYSFSAVIGLSQEDDDGNAASNKTEPKEKMSKENGNRLDELENWRMMSEDNIEVKAKTKDGRYVWKNLDNVTLKGLEFLREDERFEGIKQFVEQRIAMIKKE